MAAKTDPLKLVQGKRPTIASLPLCMDPDAFSEASMAKVALDEAEARLAGLNARLNALDDGAAEAEIAELEGKPSSRANETRLKLLKGRWAASPVLKVRAEVDAQTPVVEEARKRL